MGIEFFTRLPLHGEAEFLAGDPRNRGDWARYLAWKILEQHPIIKWVMTLLILII